MSTPVRLADYWKTVKAHVATTALSTVLVTGKVYLEGEDYSKPEGAEGGQWGRVVLVPTMTSFPTAPLNSEFIDIGLLVRAEFSNYQNVNYRPQVALEAALQLCYRQLHGWVPAATSQVQPATAFMLIKPWQDLPMWDDQRGLYFLSMLFNSKVTHVGIEPIGTIGSEGGAFIGV